MADDNYEGQTKIYIKQGTPDPTELIVASTGYVKVENGGYIEAESGGTIQVDSGGILDLQDGSTFYNSSLTINSTRMMMNILGHTTLTNYVSDLISVLAVSRLTAYGYGFFSLAAGCSKASADLGVPISGAYTKLIFSGILSNAALSLFAQSGGGLTSCSCETIFGSNVSSLGLAATSNAGWIEMVCFNDGCWTITEYAGEITPNAAA